MKIWIIDFEESFLIFVQFIIRSIESRSEMSCGNNKKLIVDEVFKGNPLNICVWKNLKKKRVKKLRKKFKIDFNRFLW